MKSFILICRAINGVGGAQLYARNKALYYKSIGWEAHIFSFRKGIVYIQGLDEYENRICPELGFPSYLYSDNEKNRLLRWMLSFISESDEYVIESDSILLSSWAEELAKKVNGKHFVYILDEQPRTFGLSRDFLNFKLKRNEVAGITGKVIKWVLPNITIEKSEELVLHAFCINSIDDVDDSGLPELRNKVKIGIFGRLNKPYVKPITEKLIEYISKNKELSFSVVYIGGSPNQSDIKHLNDNFKNLSNVEMQITGFICPVPRSFIEKFDFFISMAGSANALYLAGFLTISIDGYKFNPNGIMGITTTKALDTEENQPKFEDLLDCLIYKKQFERDQLTRRDYYDLNSYFEPHIKFVEKSKNEFRNKYYDFSSVGLPIKFLLLKMILGVIRPAWLRRVIDGFVNVG